jgi:hypothetical protein
MRVLLWLIERLCLVNGLHSGIGPRAFLGYPYPQKLHVEGGTHEGLGPCGSIVRYVDHAERGVPYS